jgi:hypothetical protein
MSLLTRVMTILTQPPAGIGAAPQTQRNVTCIEKL